MTIARAFGLGKHEVTRGEFAAFVAETGHQAGGSCWTLRQKPEGGGHSFQDAPGATWRNLGFAQTDGDPVVCVSWDDAKAYVAWLSRKANRMYR